MDLASISKLASLLRENGDKVLNEFSKLSLTAALVQNLNEAFNLIVQENEACGSSFQVINTNHTKVEILHDLQFLHDFVQKTAALKITSGLYRNDSLKSNVDISKFRSLRYLELKKLSVNLMTGIQSVRCHLQSIICTQCNCKLEEVLKDCGGDKSGGIVWGGLQEAVFTYNGICVLDRSLEFTPWLQFLDLSHNKLVHAEAIDCLPNLKYLNLSFNFLESVPVISAAAHRTLHTLVIKNNYIEDISGLCGLENLVKLDLSCNFLMDHQCLRPLAELHSLSWINLEENPLSFHRDHRQRTAAMLHASTVFTKFLLDGILLNRFEQEQVGMLNVTRQERTDTSSAASSTASDRTLTPQVSSRPPDSIRKGGRVREAVISEHDSSMEGADLSTSLTASVEISTEHLETKKQIETLRKTFGEEHWLHSQGGSCVQDILGLTKPSMPPHTDTTQVVCATQNQTVESVSTTDTEANKVMYQVLLKKLENESAMQVAEMETTMLNVQCKEVEEEPTAGSEAQSPVESEVILEEEEEDEEELYLVQKQQPGTEEMDELFLAMTRRFLKEREVLCGKIKEKWPMECLLSCVKITSNPPTVQLTFDTLLRDRQERLYVMDAKDLQRLSRVLSDLLDARSLAEMNQMVYRCMKCSSQFSQETTLSSADTSTKLSCPTCRSPLVIQMEEVPLPSGNRNLPRQWEAATLGMSESQSSIGSAASLNHLPDYHNNADAPVRRCDSDIEIISNPSQSSIEVLEEQARNHGSTPVRKRSEERRLESAQAAVKVLDACTQALSAARLTESSSSGSLTDSVCTTYEHPHGTPSKKRVQHLTNPPTESLDLYKENGKTESDLKESGNIESDNSEVNKLSENTSNNSVLPFYNPSPSSKFSSVLEDLRQRMEAKLSPNTAVGTGSRIVVAGKDVQYSYSNFGLVDHRVKLHLFLHVFEEEQEELVFLLRAQVMSQSVLRPFPGCLVFSTEKAYVLRITGIESDEPEKWLEKTESYALNRLVTLCTLPWGQGVTLEVQELPSAGPGSIYYAFLLQDEERTSNFLSYFEGLKLPESCQVAVQKFSDKHTLLVQWLLLSAGVNGDSDPGLRLFTIFSKCSVAGNEGTKEMGMGALLICVADLVLTDDSVDWLLPHSSQLVPVQSSQKMSNLLELEVDGLSLTLQFLDEAADTEETWKVSVPTQHTVQEMVAAIKDPWEELFSVPLQVTTSDSPLLPFH